MIILFEGIDGTGKSTQAKLLYEKLKSDGEKVQLLREPGGTEFADAIREFLLTTEKVSHMSRRFLYKACHFEIYEKRIKDFDGITILDRVNYISDLAFQDLASGEIKANYGDHAIDYLSSMHECIDTFEPNLIFYMRVAPDDVSYLNDRFEGRDKNHLDSIDVKEKERMASVYESIMQSYAKSEEGPIVIPINSLAPESKISVDTEKEFSRYIGLKLGKGIIRSKEYNENLREEVKRLLVDKGFLGTLTMDQIYSRILSEVGESINSYKKGLPKDDLAEELADIYIYTFNLMYKENNKVSELYCIVPESSSECNREEASDYKFRVFNNMCRDIARSSLAYDLLLNNKDWIHSMNFEESIKKVLSSIIECSEEHGVDLRCAIDEKMKKNKKRPHRYNTDKSLFRKDSE